MFFSFFLFLLSWNSISSLNVAWPYIFCIIYLSMHISGWFFPCTLLVSIHYFSHSLKLSLARCDGPTTWQFVVCMYGHASYVLRVWACVYICLGYVWLLLACAMSTSTRNLCANAELVTTLCHYLFCWPTKAYFVVHS
jgi:hypothetical protein